MEEQAEKCSKITEFLFQLLIFQLKILCPAQGVGRCLFVLLFTITRDNIRLFTQ